MAYWSKSHSPSRLCSLEPSKPGQIEMYTRCVANEHVFRHRKTTDKDGKGVAFRDFKQK
jgi:hypothetical protein